MGLASPVLSRAAGLPSPPGLPLPTVASLPRAAEMPWKRPPSPAPGVRGLIARLDMPLREVRLRGVRGLAAAASVRALSRRSRASSSFRSRAWGWGLGAGVKGVANIS